MNKKSEYTFLIEVGSSRFDRIINIPVLIEKPCFPVFIELLSGYYQKGPVTVARLESAAKSYTATLLSTTASFDTG